MSELLVKNLPVHLHVRLKRRAALNRRSLSAEVITLLERTRREGRGTVVD